MKAFVVSKRLLIIIFLSLVLFALIFGKFYSVKAKEWMKNGETNTDRLDYLYSLGLDVDPTPSIENIVIPFEFSDVYNEYNKLQIKSGFNLEIYRGKEVCKYTYNLTEDEFTFVNLLVFDGMVIGGDVCNVRLNGFIKPLLTINNE